MPEENKPKSYEDHHRENLRKDAERKQRMENVRQQTIQRLTTDPDIQAYFKQYNPTSIDSFISGYATWKSIFLEYGNMYEDIAEKRYSEYFDRAQHCLKEIQLKKLFHLRRQWGANLVKPEGILCSWDFLPLSEDIMNCNLVPPITEEEFQLYMQYAASPHFEYNEYTSWASVESMSDKDADRDDDVPGWFYYHNTYTNAGMYMQLPDYRGEKESFYRSLVSKEEEAERERKYASGELKRHVPETRPLLSNHKREQLLQFMHEFEDAETIRLFNNHEQYGSKLTFAEDDDNSEYLNERVESIIFSLSSMKEVRLPIEANTDWRQGLMDAWEKFETQQTIAHLPLAYDDYLFRLGNKIKFPLKDSYDYTEFAATLRKKILRGRELNNEPMDFDF